MVNPLCELHQCGQSFWVDTISREMLKDGTLKRLVRLDGLRGMTSNPDIFQKAITGSALYDAQIRKLALAGKPTTEIYEALAVEDIRAAADILRPVYDESKGLDGCVSLEVSPYLAYDCEGTVAEARRLWAMVQRPNVFIKIPATPECIPAIREVIRDGINVNVTLIFSLSCYEDVMWAYIGGLKDRAAVGKPVDGILSVASFFVSRIDTLLDKMIAQRIAAIGPGEMGLPVAALQGRVAVASAKLAYARFEEVFGGPDFAPLQSKGARVQRPLWASTSTKNPAYRDTMYVDPLVGPDTVNTMPLVLVDAVRDHGDIQPGTVREGLDEARAVMAGLDEAGIDLEKATWQLQEEGVQKFAQPFDKLLTSLSEKRLEACGFLVKGTLRLGSLEKAAAARLDVLTDSQYVVRLHRKDPTIWTGGHPGVPEVAPIANRLGWTDVAAVMEARVTELAAFAEEVRNEGIRHVVLLGMGGSSLCPEVCMKVFGAKKGYPTLHIGDSTHPEGVAALTKALDLKRSLFIVASKSGSTAETNALYQHFRAALEGLGVAQAGRHFIAITDPATALGSLAAKGGFRRTFENPADIGGRYSALSLFGLVPMALIGMDLARLLARVRTFAADAGAILPAAADPSVRLGASLGALALAGRTKLTLWLSPDIAPLGDWIEQLVAESTGKRGVGILPVVGERPLAPAAYGKDRVFVSVTTGAKNAFAPKLKALETAGHPVAELRLSNVYDLGAAFLGWEIATATAGAVLGINPFDEPDVNRAKDKTRALLAEVAKSGRLEFPKPALDGPAHAVWMTDAARKVSGKAKSAGELVAGLVKGLAAGEYAAVCAFLPPGKPVEPALEALRAAITARTKCAATAAIGPRYLHSTGQLHKGGANNGLFILFTSEAAADVPIPGQTATFDQLCRAQAMGDFEALADAGRRAVLIHLKKTPAAALKSLAQALVGRK